MHYTGIYCLILITLNCPLVSFLFKKSVFTMRMVQLQVCLGFSILYPLFSSDYVASWFLAQSCYCCWIPSLITGIPVHDCLVQMKVMQRELLILVLSSQLFPNLGLFVSLAALDMGRSDLADLLASICIGDCNVLDSGVLRYTIKLWYKSLPSS